MKNNTTSEIKTTKPSRKTGKVVENKRYKEGTITVMVRQAKYLSKYHRTFYDEKKILVHYAKRELIPINTPVEIEACRKISKRKNFKITRLSGKPVSYKEQII